MRSPSLSAMLSMTSGLSLSTGHLPLGRVLRSAAGFRGPQIVSGIVIAVAGAPAAAAVEAVRVRADTKALVVLAFLVALVLARLVVPAVINVSGLGNRRAPNAA